ncbi:MAG: PCRF domain-containing protein [Clostridiales bacterium]|jgi:peptide chain release factor 1|nr:PCRF domain-containing protein [Clostridiales bacterium]
MTDFIAGLLAVTAGAQERYDELSGLIAAPEIIAHNSYWRTLAAEALVLEPIVKKREQIKKLSKEREICLAELSAAQDAEMRRLIEAEERGLCARLQSEAAALRLLLIADKIKAAETAVIEIKTADASATAAELAFLLCKAYAGYAKNNSYDFLVDESDSPDTGKMNFALIKISGAGAYTRLKNESGVHRMISAAGSGEVFVWVCAEADDDGEIVINDKDIRIDLFHSGGAGGQNINKVETAVRITHKPSGIVVVCQDERSQLKNKERAMQTLKAKLSAVQKKRRGEILAEERRQKKAVLNKKFTIRLYNQITGEAADIETGAVLPLDKVFKGGIDGFIDVRILRNQSGGTAWTS